jgi:hypothetical protein
MIFGWAKSALAAWRRSPILVNALLLALGCGNTESNPEPDEPDENVPVGWQCQRYALSDYCAKSTCPDNQAEAEANAQKRCALSQAPSLYRQATACGGAAVGGFMGYQFFDAAGDLIGITFSSDIGSNGCGQDVPGRGKTTIYGNACALTGEATDLCMP